MSHQFRLPSLNSRRIIGVLRQTWYFTFHSMETWIDLFWFPIVSLLLFGFLSTVLAGSNPTIAVMLLIGYMLWEVVRISQYCITVSVMWEVWSRSFNTMFVSPLNMAEVMIGYIISGTIKTMFAISIIAAISLFVFHTSVFILGPMLLLYLVILFSFGFAVGMFVTGLIFRFNTDIQSLAWGLIYVFQPISAIFYPVEALPIQIRWLAYASPITYVMENTRAQLNGQPVNVLQLGISAVVTSIMVIAAYGFMHLMYQWARRTGSFARLGN